MITKVVDEENGNPLKVWHDIGEPANPSREQIGLLREVARPMVCTKKVVASKGSISISLT